MIFSSFLVRFFRNFRLAWKVRRSLQKNKWRDACNLQLWHNCLCWVYENAITRVISVTQYIMNVLFHLFFEFSQPWSTSCGVKHVGMIKTPYRVITWEPSGNIFVVKLQCPEEETCCKFYLQKQHVSHIGNSVIFNRSN